MKVSIIGAGNVGSTTCQLIAYKNLADIVLLDKSMEKAKGIALDLLESSPLEGMEKSIAGTGNYADTGNSDLVIITAGSPRKEGQSREDLLEINSAIIKEVISNAVKFSPNAVFIVVTNPLDAMVFLAMKAGKIKKEKIVGMAGVLDSSRFAEFIALELNVSPKDVSALVLGSHGDLMVPVVSQTFVKGKPLISVMKKEKIDELVQRTRNAGAEIISLMKTSAYYDTGASITVMAEAILGNKKEILPCSAFLQGEYGLKDLFIGVPVQLGAKGVEKIIEIDLTQEEKNQFLQSAQAIKKIISGVKA